MTECLQKIKHLSIHGRSFHRHLAIKYHHPDQWSGSEQNKHGIKFEKSPYAR